MVRFAAIVIASAGCLMAAASTTFTSSLGVPGATAAVTDPGGNIYVVAGASLIRLSSDGSIQSNTQPVTADSTLTSLALDPRGRVVVGGSNPNGGFVARPPDFVTPVSGNVLQVAVDSGGTIWAATSLVNLVRLSADGAVTMTKFVGGASTDTPSSLVIDPAGSLYLALVTSSAELPASTGFQPFLNGIAGAVSYDGGNYFYSVYGVTAAINQWLLTDPNTLYVATQGQGVNHSSDRGQTFDSRSQGLPDLTVRGLAVDPANAQILYAATGKGLAKSTTSGTAWSAIPLPTGTAPVSAVAVHPKNRTQLFVAVGCALYRSTDTGATWTQQPLADCVSQFALDANNVYALTPSGVYTMSGTQASAIAGLNALAIDSTTWYASATGGVYKSLDSGATWTLVNPGGFNTLAFGKPYLIAGTRAGTIAVSRDGGATWNVSSPFAQPVRSLLADSGTVFAGASYNSGIWLGKFAPGDAQLLSSTFLGGSGSETAARLAVDAQGVVTVAMETDSTDAATTYDAAQRRSGGGIDIVITRLTSAFALQYASYFGGAGDEHLGGLALDAQGFLYMGGSTAGDAFAAVFNPSANGLVYTSNFSGAAGVAFVPDNRGNAVFVGTTASPADSFVTSLTGLISYQPLGSIRNAATLAVGSLAPGSLATIDGSFGDLSGITVTFNGIPAAVIQSRDTSMDVVVPDGVTPGQVAFLGVQSRNGLSQGTVQIDPVAPGLFSANHDGKGVAQATLTRLDAFGNEDTEQVFECADTCVAVPIDFGDDTDTLFLQLAATGLRGEKDLTQFQVNVNGQAIAAAAVAAQGISAGLDQLTIQLPRPPAGFIGPAIWTIQVTVDGKTSNTVTITVG